MQKSLDISIIIVDFKAKKKLIECIRSIKSFLVKSTYEIIVVDNDKEKHSGKVIKKFFPEVVYVKNNVNKGWGAGVNYGLSFARGKYILLLNPDIVLLSNIIDELFNFMKKNKNIGVLSSLLFSSRDKPYEYVGSEYLTPLKALFTMSFFNKLFPNNPISKRFYMKDWNKKTIQKVDVPPLSASLIKKDLLLEIGGINEEYFLYFEEYDLSQKLKEKKLKNYILPFAKALHYHGISTKTRSDTSSFFIKSKFYFFKKYFGIIPALIVHVVTSIGKYEALISLITLFGLFIRMYKINELMPFIGDYGWFYISARDFLVNGWVPLVGIASSHPWLHQGPFWTYMLAFVLWISHFNPISGGYLAVFIGLVTIWMAAKFASELFSKRAGYICALLYATSPLTVIYSRIPYHTAPISFLTLLYMYSLYKWVQGQIGYFVFAIFLISVLYNFELSTVLLASLLLLLLGFGIVKKKKWARRLLNEKIIMSSIFCFFIPLIPFLIYDFTHGYPQTIKFAAWIGYKIISVVIPFSHSPVTSYKELLAFLGIHLKRLIFLDDGLISWGLIVISLGWFLFEIYNQHKKKKLQVSYTLIFLWIVISVGGYFLNRSTSEAYLPILLPVIIFVVSLFFDWLLNIKRIGIVFLLLLFCMVSLNIKALFENNYLMIPYGGYGYEFSQRLDVSKTIVKEASNKEYNIIGEGRGSEFQSFNNNYEYLTWWLGHGPSLQKQPLWFVIRENEEGIVLKKFIEND